MFEKDCVIAIVQGIVPTGKHGAFAIAKCDELEGSITFSLEPTVWKESGYPKSGETVYLTRIGWQAKSGRYYKPSDEQLTNRKEQNISEAAGELREKMRERFPRAENDIWKRWVDFKERNGDDLLKLISADVRESFKRRAIFLLLVPSADFNPIYWKGGTGRFYHKAEFLVNLRTSTFEFEHLHPVG